MVDLAKDWVPLEELVGAALDRLAGHIGRREVKVDLPPKLPMVQADPVLLGQVIINLVENADKFSPPGPAHRDQGLGHGTDHHPVGDRPRPRHLPEGQEEQIFEKLVRFQQGEARPGAGLGLAICKGVVQAHGGKILASNRPQGGAKFR